MAEILVSDFYDDHLPLLTGDRNPCQKHARTATAAGRSTPEDRRRERAEAARAAALADPHPGRRQAKK